MSAEKTSIPMSGIAGLKENWKTDILSGFLVSLIALPLSLGIAKASGFPPVMGLWTAIVGGIVASFFGSAPLTIKGPAAGLIVICAGAVEAFGGEAIGWHLALACIALAGLFQILFGYLKLGSLSDFFPASVVHGMLAAIGIIIFAKQIPLALGIAPALLKGKTTFELILSIPNYVLNLDKSIAFVGLISLVIMFGLPQLKSKIVKKIPPAIIVLLSSVILGILLNLGGLENALETMPLLKVDNLFGTLGWNIDFSGIASVHFLKYFIMFLLIGSIESLLTAKAVNGLDVFRRKTNYNSDLIATGVGNVFSACFGGLPMISEIARSSANINNKARTYWSNFFHGLFLLVFVLLALSLINMIPNAALAAILISVGYRLGSPKEFIYVWNTGKEQFIIFVFTILVTLATDILMGVSVGILLKFIIHAIEGVPLGSFFKINFKLENNQDDNYFIKVSDVLVFSNYIKFKKILESIPTGKKITIDFYNSKMVDHTVMENLHNLAVGYERAGGVFEIKGLEDHKSLSKYKYATRIKFK